MFGCGISGGYVTCHYCDTAGNIEEEYEENVLRLADGGPDPDACGDSAIFGLSVMQGMKIMMVAVTLQMLMM